MCQDSFIEIKVNYAYFWTFVNNHTARITINIISHDDAPSLPVNNVNYNFKKYLQYDIEDYGCADVI